MSDWSESSRSVAVDRMTVHEVLHEIEAAGYEVSASIDDRHVTLEIRPVLRGMHASRGLFPDFQYRGEIYRGQPAAVKFEMLLRHGARELFSFQERMGLV